MRIVIDLEEAQSEVGHSADAWASLRFAQAMAKQQGDHEIVVILSDLFAHTLERIRWAFADLLPECQVRTYRVHGPVAAKDPNNSWRREAGIALRNAFIDSLDPDCIIVTNLFGGWQHDGLTTIDTSKNGRCVAVFLPEIKPVKKAICGSPEPRYLAFLQQKLQELSRAHVIYVPSITAQQELQQILPTASAIIPVCDDNASSWLASLKLGQNQTINASTTNKHSSWQRHSLAVLSPVPPARSGIADYTAELLQPLSKHYAVTVIHDQEEVSREKLPDNCAVRTSTWFEKNAQYFDRVLYHFGNSGFHRHMFALIKGFPGVVVLHDFYLGHVVCEIEQNEPQNAIWMRTLQEGHGYAALQEYCSTDYSTTVWAYPCNSVVINHALGMIAHSRYSLKQAEHWYGNNISQDWNIIPLLRSPSPPGNRAEARARIGIPEDAFIVCSFGSLAKFKLNHRLLNAWCASRLACVPHSYLVFVGEMHPGEYQKRLHATIKRTTANERIIVTDFVSADTYQAFLESADIAVQLRTMSRGETSAAVLDCMNYGLATIVNAHASMAELPNDVVLLLPNEFSDNDLTSALNLLWQDKSRRLQLGKSATNFIKQYHNPEQVAKLYKKAIENAYADGIGVCRERAIRSIAAIPGMPNDRDMMVNAESLAYNLPFSIPQRTLFVDISIVVDKDLRTGIQRVTRAVVQQLIAHPPHGFIIEPVYATSDSEYRYARGFTRKMLGCTVKLDDDTPLFIKPGDIFLALDFAGLVLLRNSAFIQSLRNLGGKFYAVLYDLLPISHSHYFPATAVRGFQLWLETISTLCDGIIGISRNVAEQMHNWLKNNAHPRHSPLKIGWFHLGSDIKASVPSKGVSDELHRQIAQFSHYPTVLTVGTVEPRKGHDEILATFEFLWANKKDIVLVIVGKEGWQVETLANRIRKHKQHGHRLFWYDRLSDEGLLQLYGVCSGVLVASHAEGFGLSLIEAAAHNKPVLARDIPVFREVAQDHISYFNDDSPAQFAGTICEWLDAISLNIAPVSNKMKQLSWQESTTQLTDLLLDNNHQRWLYNVPSSVTAAALHPGEIIEFNSPRVLWYNWTFPYDMEHRWTIANQASIHFIIGDKRHWRGQLVIDASTPSPQHISITLNDVELATGIFHLNREEWAIDICGLNLVPGADYVLSFYFSDIDPRNINARALCLFSFTMR